MATKKRNTKKQISEFTIEERNVIGIYRVLNKWEKLALCLLMQSTAFGRLTTKSENYSVPQMRRMLCMWMRNGFYRGDSSKKGARHG